MEEALEKLARGEISPEQYFEAKKVVLRMRLCMGCNEPCCNVRHPDTLDYDQTLPACHCCRERE